MATRSRKAVEPKSGSTARVGASASTATTSATQRVAPTRATRSTRNGAPAGDDSAPVVAPVPKGRTVVKKVVAEKVKPVATAVKKAPTRTQSKTLATVVPDENDREPIKVG